MASTVFQFFVVCLLSVSVKCIEKRFFFDSLSNILKPYVNLNSSLSNCKSSYADIAFLLDTSRSETSNDFLHQKQFISNFINSLDVGPHQAQISVITYSTHAFIHFYLDQYDNKADVLHHIDSMGYIRGSTHTWEALDVLHDYIFIPGKGDRRTAPNIVVILTDGHSQYPYDTYFEAEKLRDEEVKIFAVGIGNDISENELLNIGGDREHVFHVKSSDLLGDIQKALHTLYCDAMAGTICDNKIGNCNHYYHTCSSDMYRLWAEENCAKYCGFCNPVTTPAMPSSQRVTTSITPIVQTNIIRSTSQTLPPRTTTRLSSSSPVKTTLTKLVSSTRSSPATTNIPSTITQAPVPTTLHWSNGQCVNKIINCPAYGAGVCLSYREWSIKNCPQFCQFCKGTVATPPPIPTTTLPPTTTTVPMTTKTTSPPTPAPISSGPCINAINNCHAYGTSVCTVYRDWSAKNCPLFCQFCVGTSTPPKPSLTSQMSTTITVSTTHLTLPSYSSCEDKVSTCASYGPDVCVKYHDWAAVQCAKFCLFCDEKQFTATSPTTTTTKATTTTTIPPTPTTTSTTTTSTTLAPTTTSTVAPTTTITTTKATPTTTRITTMAPSTTPAKTTKIPHTNPTVIVIGRR